MLPFSIVIEAKNYIQNEEKKWPKNDPVIEYLLKKLMPH